VTGYRELLAQPGVTRLVAAMVAARFGGGMIQLTVVLFVLEHYHSPGLAGLVGLGAGLSGIAAGYPCVGSARIPMRGRAKVQDAERSPSAGRRRQKHKGVGGPGRMPSHIAGEASVPTVGRPREAQAR